MLFRTLLCNLRNTKQMLIFGAERVGAVNSSHNKHVFHDVIYTHDSYVNCVMTVFIVFNRLPRRRVMFSTFCRDYVSSLM